jgi:DNA invertase Pin-like site-specific DNA recombinase
VTIAGNTPRRRDKLSRFGRSMSHLFELFDPFGDDGVDLIFLDIGVDPFTSQGSLLRNVISALAEYESDHRPRMRTT